MTCNKCGNELKNDELYCGQCGNKVLDSNSNQSPKDNEPNTLKIKLTHLIFIISIIAMIFICIILKVNNLGKSQSKSSMSSTPDALFNSSSNNVLDVVDEENREFKINGMDLINTLVNANKQLAKEDNEPVLIEYKYKKLEETVDVGFDEYAIGSPSQLQGKGVYPAFIIGVSKTSGNVVCIGVGYPYEGYTGRTILETAVTFNYRLLKSALISLNYNELWHTIDKLSNSNNNYFNSGLKGVYYGVMDGFQRTNGTVGGEYCIFRAGKQLPVDKN